MPAVGNVIVHPDDDQIPPTNPIPSPRPSGSEAPSLVPPMLVSSINLSPTLKDVDHLVQEIKENLKLTSHGGLKMRGPLKPHKQRGSHRASPYQVPPSSRVACDTKAGDPVTTVSQLKRWNHRRRYPSTCMANGKVSGAGDQLDDPFQMLQELITDGGLIKEAVRRLQLGLTPKYSTTSTTTSSNKNRSFYDSDDECRTPPAYPELCCEVGGI